MIRHKIPVCREAPLAEIALLLIVIVSGALIGFQMDYTRIGLVLAAIGLFVAIWINFIRPALHKRKLKRPVRAHFTNRNQSQSLSGRNVLHDAHHIRRLVLPAQSNVNVEIGFNPIVPFHLKWLVAHIGGDESLRPKIIGRAYPDIEYGTRPSDEQDRVRLGIYQAKFDDDMNIGTHRVIGFKIKTEKAGLYPVRLSFITTEIEGNFDGLEILVEDDPHTIMRCHKRKHGLDCRVSPIKLR